LLGLAAVLSASATAFLIVKLLGALYLVFLGVKALRSRARPTPVAQAGKGVPRGALLRDGVFVATFNPKTTLFFAAFLPQFIDAGAASPLGQGLVLGAVFVAIALCTDTLYVLTGLKSHRLRQAPIALAPIRSVLERGDFHQPRCLCSARDAEAWTMRARIEIRGCKPGHPGLR